jgi:hypothetical protein
MGVRDASVVAVGSSAVEEEDGVDDGFLYPFE